MGRKSWFVGVILVGIVGLLAACTPSKASKETKQHLNWSETSAIVTNDPSLATDTVSFNVLNNTQEGIYRLTNKGQTPALGLAQKVDVSADGLTYRVTLRHAKWSNGDPIKAADFVYSWQRTVDPKTKAADAFYFAPVKNATAITQGKLPASELGVKATDDTHLVITLATPTAYFKKLLAFPLYFPQNKKTVVQYGAQYGKSAAAQVFSGPFKLTKWNGTSDSWQLVKNTQYWDQKHVKLDQIDETVVKDAQTAINLYQTKKLDAITLTGEQAAAHLHDSDAVARLSSNMTRVDLNQNKVAAFKNLKVRQAFSQVIDRGALVNKVLKDGSKAAIGFIPVGLQTDPQTKADFAKTSVVKEAVAYDPSEAKRLLAEGLKEVGQSQLNVTLLADDTDVAKQVAEYLQGAMTSLPNVKVTIRSIPKAQRLQAQTAGDYDMVVTGWQSIFADAYNFLDVWLSQASYNSSGYHDAAFDQLLADSEGKYGNAPQQRWTTLQAAEKKLMNDQATLPLYQSNNLQLLRQTVKGINFNPNGTPYDFKQAYLQ